VALTMRNCPGLLFRLVHALPLLVRRDGERRCPVCASFGTRPASAHPP
jgi:hypothetical protein